MNHPQIFDDRRTDHETRKALLRLRLVEKDVHDVLANKGWADLSILPELHAAIDGVINLIRYQRQHTEHTAALADRLLHRGTP